jgi:DNA polymerase III subunit epsilon
VFNQFENLKLDRKLVVMSLDATGPNYKTDRIVQFALLCITPDDVPRVFAADVNPGFPISPAATAVHGVSDKDVARSRRFADYAAEIWEYLDDAVLVGGDIKKFALPLLIKEFERCGLKFSLRRRLVIDVLQIFRDLESPEGPHDLSAAYLFYCGKRLEEAQRLDRNVDAIAQLLDRQLGCYPKLPRTITELHDEFAAPDLLGLFREGDGGLVFNFGKYFGKLLSEIGQCDPGYLRWMLESREFLEDVQESAKYSLGLAYCEE